MIVVVRHGNTFAPGETPRRIGAATDLPLVPSGREQGRMLAREMRRYDFARCYVSPLRRTRETADLIAPACPTETADWLREIDHGPDEGRTEAQVRERIGEDALAAWERDATAPPGWTVDADRRCAAWRALMLTATEPVLCVTSNGAARFALIAIGAPPTKLRTGAYGVLRRHGERWSVEGWDIRPER